MIRKIERIATLDAKKITVVAALIAVIAAHNLHPRIGAANAQRGLAAIAAVRADRAHVLHLPGTRLVAISTGSKRAHRANVDAHPALFALQVILFIRSDN